MQIYNILISKFFQELLVMIKKILKVQFIEINLKKYTKPFIKLSEIVFGRVKF